MKKITYLFLLGIILIFSFSFVGCSLEEYVNLRDKPTDLYYTQSLSESIKSEISNVRILETSFYKETTLKGDTVKLISDLVSAINKENLIAEATSDESELPEKPLYKIYIDTKNQKKYVIDIYGDDLISIFPWDGYYKKDILQLSNVPASLKPEVLCKYLLSL